MMGGSTRTLAAVVALAAIAYLAACAALFFLQRSLIYFPQPGSAAGAASIELPVDGATLQITLRPHAGSKAVIYFGGNAEDVSASLPDLSAALADRAIFLMHYRGWGRSSGTPSEAALHKDALVLFDRVHAAHPDVVVIGRSLGSAIAVRLASQRPVTRLVLVTPFDSLQGLAAAQFPMFPVRWLLLDKFESGRYAASVTAPTLIIAAERDEVIARSSTNLLHARFAADQVKFVVLAGTGHNTISASPLYWPLVREFAGGQA